MSRLRVYNVTLEPAAALAAVRSSGHRADVNASAPAVFSVDVVGGALVVLRELLAAHHALQRLRAHGLCDIRFHEIMSS